MARYPFLKVDQADHHVADESHQSQPRQACGRRARPVPIRPELVALLSNYLKKSRSRHPGPALRLGDRHVKGIQGPAHRLRDDLVKVARSVVEGRDGRGDYRAGQRGF